MIFHCFMLVLVNPAWSGDMDEAALRDILNRSDTTLNVYFIRSSILTRIPVTAERMRKGAYECKLFIKSNSIVKQMAEVIIEAGENYDGRKYDGFVRLLVDVISDGTIVYSLSSPKSYLDSGTDIKMLLEEIRKFAMQD